MKFFNNIFSRFTALVVLTAFLFVSCPLPGPSPVVITPGEGNPRYAYLDLDGNVIETDDFERTLFFIENNRNAEGVLIVADEVNSEARVVIHNQNNNSTVSMFFRQGSNFPYHMIIYQDTETCYAYLSYYKTASSTYDIAFEEDGEIAQMTDLVLNRNIFDVYQNDPYLTDSQNLRLYNITVALGLCGSLYNAFDESMYQFRALFLRDLIGIVRNVFHTVALVAAFVAYVVAPVVSIFIPDAEQFIYKAANVVIEASFFIISCLTQLEEKIYGSEPSSPKYVKINVKNCYEDKPIMNGVEFHIGVGEDVLLEFCLPGVDFSGITLADIYDGEEYIYEPGNNLYPKSKNSDFFTVSLERGEAQPPDSFLIRIERGEEGFIASGKTSFGFMFNHEGEDIYINKLLQPVEFKFKSEETPSNRTNLVVTRFCIYPNCSPDPRD